MLRDGVWSEREAEILVPGDIISIKLGDIVPADARLLEGDPLKIDQVMNGSGLGYCAIQSRATDKFRQKLDTYPGTVLLCHSIPGYLSWSLADCVSG